MTEQRACSPLVVAGRCDQWQGYARPVRIHGYHDRHGFMIDPTDILHAIENSGECHIVTDTSGIILYASPGMQALSGYAPGELIGRSTRIFKSDTNPPAIYDDLWETILRRERWTGVLQNRRKDGSHYLERLTITPVVNEQNEIAHFHCRKDAADPSSSAPHERVPGFLLRHTPSEQRPLNDVMSRMSYELRTALNSILGFTQILHEDLRSRIDEAQDEYFTIVEQSGNRLLRMIEEVLLLSQLETGEYSFHFTTFAAAREIRRVIGNVTVLANTEHLRFIKVIEDNGALVTMDRQCFEQIITNLLINSIKFTEQGTVTIGLETRNGEVVVSIIDTGMGISDAFKPHVFQPFRQEEIGLNAEFEGVGLGLAITRRMIEIMGGKIGFESKKGEGSSFIVRFPIVGWEKDLGSA